MIPDVGRTEGGESAAGAGLDHPVGPHPAYAEASATAGAAGLGLLDFLERRAVARFGNPAEAALLAREIHVLPEFLGNRSPYADPDARAVVAGLSLDDDVDSLERLFLAGLCGLAYGLADVVDAMRAHGIPCQGMVISGGARPRPLVRPITPRPPGPTPTLPMATEAGLLAAATLRAL